VRKDGKKIITCGQKGGLRKKKSGTTSGKQTVKALTLSNEGGHPKAWGGRGRNQAVFEYISKTKRP